MMLRDLAWLAALAEHGHVTETAAVLHTTQPTLSRTLARVEQELGARLFERTADGVHPTPAGALAVAAARDLTARYAQLRSALDSLLDPDTGEVRLAFVDSMATSLVPRILRAFREHAPGVRILLRQEPGHVILRDLGTGAADLAVIGARPGGDVGWHPLQRERLVLVVPPRHRLRTRRRVGLAELAGEPFITTPVGFGFRTLFDALFQAAGAPRPAISFESQDLATIEGLVAAGLGVAILPEPFAGQSGTVGIRITAEAAQRTIGLVWRTDRPLAAPAARLRDFVITGAPFG